MMPPDCPGGRCAQGSVCRVTLSVITCAYIGETAALAKLRWPPSPTLQTIRTTVAAARKARQTPTRQDHVTGHRRWTPTTSNRNTSRNRPAFEQINVEALSIEELRDFIAHAQAEIARAEAEITSKQALRGDAAALFKK